MNGKPLYLCVLVKRLIKQEISTTKANKKKMYVYILGAAFRYNIYKSDNSQGPGCH